MDLQEAGIGDTITVPAHHPATVTVTGWRQGITDDRAYIWGWMKGALVHLSWTAPGWSGVTSLSEATAVVLVEKAGLDHPLRAQYEADLEAQLAALLDTADDMTREG